MIYINLKDNTIIRYATYSQSNDSHFGYICQQSKIALS